MLIFCQWLWKIYTFYQGSKHIISFGLQPLSMCIRNHECNLLYDYMRYIIVIEYDYDFQSPGHHNLRLGEKCVLVIDCYCNYILL